MSVHIPQEADFDAQAHSLSNARNNLMFIMGLCMHEGKRYLESCPTMVGLSGRKFAGAATAFLMLKFVQEFDFLEDITKGGPYGEPISLGARIHEHLVGSAVPISVLNSLEDLRVMGNQVTFVYGNTDTLEIDQQLKVLFVMRLVAKYILRGGNVGRKVHLSARKDGKTANPPGPKPIYVKSSPKQNTINSNGGKKQPSMQKRTVIKGVTSRMDMLSPDLGMQRGQTFCYTNDTNQDYEYDEVGIDRRRGSDAADYVVDEEDFDANDHSFHENSLNHSVQEMWDGSGRLIPYAHGNEEDILEEDYVEDHLQELDLSTSYSGPPITAVTMSNQNCASSQLEQKPPRLSQSRIPQLQKQPVEQEMKPKGPPRLGLFVVDDAGMIEGKVTNISKLDFEEEVEKAKLFQGNLNELTTKVEVEENIAKEKGGAKEKQKQLVSLSSQRSEDGSPAAALQRRKGGAKKMKAPKSRSPMKAKEAVLII
eukprot:m.2448 g.2448  ORF g.2448 m.2448 type:complete len:480 (+) comp1791_c0_seq1:66-1505(+)